MVIKADNIDNLAQKLLSLTDCDKTSIRIKTPSGWKRNYLAEALKKSGVKGKYVKEKIGKNTELLVSNYLLQEELNGLINLKYLIIPTSGTEEILLDKVRRKGIKIFQDKEVASRGVVQYIMGKIEEFSGEPLKSYLKGKEIGILGFGRIGEGIYETLSNYECKFRVIRKRHIQLSSKLVYCGNLNDVENVLYNSDIVVNTLPLNNETSSALTEKTALFKNGSVIIGVSRSGILNEKEILDGVVEGKFGGAIFDVYPKKINPRDYRKYKNIILTPHVAAIYGNNLENIVQFIKSKIDLLA